MKLAAHTKTTAPRHKHDTTRRQETTPIFNAWRIHTDDSAVCVWTRRSSSPFLRLL